MVRSLASILLPFKGSAFIFYLSTCIIENICVFVQCDGRKRLLCTSSAV